MIDVFAGAGGLSLGFEQAGFEIAACVELDPVHAAVHSFNFPYSHVMPVSAASLKAKDLLSRAGLKRGQVDVVVGGAPCQGFSLIGQRMLDDPRNMLVHHFVRLVVELRAPYFVFENVKGLTAGQHRRFLDELIQEFHRHGYAVRDPWMVLNAAEFGVPQARERLFLLGARRSLPLPEYPRPTSSVKGSLTHDALAVTPTCRDALADLPDADVHSELLDSDSVWVGAVEGGSGYSQVARCLVRGSWGFGYRRRWDREVLTSSARTRHTQISRHRFAITKPGEVEPISRFFKLHPDGVSNTLRAGTDAARGAFTSPRPIHYKYPRCITVREMARLQGFPDWFRFHSTKWHGARQVGNSVPPPLAQAVAREVGRAMGYRPRRPSKMISLGDASLLQFDMAAASAHWGVPRPHGRRDRRSGAKKRKQVDIERARHLSEGTHFE